MCIGKEIWTAMLFVLAMLWGRETVGDEQKKDDLEELQAMWKSQRSEIATAHIRYRLFQWGASDLLPLKPEQVKTILTSKDLAANPDDLRILVNKLRQQPHPSPTPWSINDFYYEGTKSKNAEANDLREVQLLTDQQQVEYSPVNSSAVIFNAGGSRRHIRAMREFRVVPDPVARYKVVEKKANLWVLQLDGARFIIDHSTGTLYEGDYYANGKIIKQDIQGSFVSYPGGIIFPSLSGRVTYDSNGNLYRISLSWIEEAEFNKELPKDTFSVAILGNTNVFDNRNSSRIRTFPKTGPVDDVIRMADEREQPVKDRLQKQPLHRRWWIVGNLVLLVSLIGIILWRRLRVRHS